MGLMGGREQQGYQGASKTFDTDELTKRIEDAKKLLGELPKRIVLAENEYKTIASTLEWGQPLVVIPMHPGVHPVGNWNGVEVYFEIKKRCYHLNARIDGDKKFGTMTCPDCGDIPAKDAINGWGDWLRENVFDKKDAKNEQDKETT